MRMTILLALTLVGTVAHAQSNPRVTAPPVEPQQKWEIDVRWAPWLGCWRAEDDFGANGTRLCVTPETVTGVKLQNIVDNIARTTETVIPDKVTRPVTDDSCRGTTRSEWSQNQQRLFRFTEVTCGTEPPRKLAGVAFLLEGPILVDVQLADLSDSKSVRVRRFVRAASQKLPDGTVAPRSSDLRGSAFGAPWTVADVIEASGKLPTDAVQAAISEANAGFRLDKTTLLAMDKAGVAPAVIDLMVALTYPKRFVVERASAPVDDSGFGSQFGWWDPFLSPMIPFAMMGRDCYSAYAYGPSYGCGAYYGYGYSPFAYLNPYSNYGYGGAYNNGWVVVDSGSNIGVTPGENTGSAEGRVVNGRGYTQIRNREPVPVPGVAGSGFNGSGSGNTSSGTNSTGSSGVSSGGGYSGGGGASSGGDSGRTAVPRPPGGGQ